MIGWPFTGEAEYLIFTRTTYSPVYPLALKRDQLKSAILVSQVPEDFFARVKLGSLRVHVVLVNFIGE